MIWGSSDDGRARQKTLKDRIGSAGNYIFGRNTLIGIASLMLLAISGYATWHGMRDFIVGVSAKPAVAPEGMSVSNDMLVIAIVVALTFLMWLALRETFGAKRKIADRLITFVLYAFLAIWSIGFGYGFWWSLISGEEATRAGLAGLQEDARDASGAVAARLDAVRAQLDNVVTWSEAQMRREEQSGGSCGIASGAGRGPLYNARLSVRDSVTTLRDGMVNSWLNPVQAEVEQLRQAAASLEGTTVEERKRSFEAKATQIRSSARTIAARSNELGQSTAAEMRALAAAVEVAPNKPGFSCHDLALAQRLKQAANQASQPVELKLRDAEFNEGPAGVANAVKNLWRNIGAFSSSLAHFVITGGDASGFKSGGEPITGRDMIALLASIGVDLGLLALAILNPPPAESLRLAPGTEHQVRQAIATAIQRAKKANIDWVRSHFIYHRDASYLVIPNLYSATQEESDQALAINQLAGVLDDLELVRWPYRKPWWKVWGKDELDLLKAEEELQSGTDLTTIRKEWLDKIGSTDGDANPEKDEWIKKSTPLRNHGVFSKAERALTFAGWSRDAIRDLEIMCVVDSEGLTPILIILNEWAEELPGSQKKQDDTQSA